MCFYFISVNHGIREPKETYCIGLILWPVNLKLENNRKVLGTRDLDDWNDLQDKLGEITLTEEKDTMIWKSCTEKFCLGEWETQIYRIFVRPTFLCKGRIQVAARLKKMNWKEEPYCKLCRIEESVNHLIFRCAPAWFLWCCLRVVFGWNEIPSSGADLINLLQGPKRDILFYCCVAASWVIWLQETFFCLMGSWWRIFCTYLTKWFLFMMQWKSLTTRKVARELETLRASPLANIQRAGGPRGCVKRHRGRISWSDLSFFLALLNFRLISGVFWLCQQRRRLPLRTVMIPLGVSNVLAEPAAPFRHFA